MSLKNRFREVLVGFEKFSFSEEQVSEAKYDFEMALTDLEACKKCRGGKCKTTANTKTFVASGGEVVEYYGDMAYYAALHEGDSKYYNRPSFRLFECGGWDKRLLDIEQSFWSKFEQQEGR